MVQSQELASGDLEAVSATPEQLMLGFVSNEKAKVGTRPALQSGPAPIHAPLRP